MNFKVFRDKAQWVALGLAIILFVLDSFTRTHYIAFVDGAYVDSTPRIVDQVWLLLVVLVLFVGLITFPRTPSLMALLSFVLGDVPFDSGALISGKQ